MPTENERIWQEISDWLAQRPDLQFALVNDILDEAISTDKGRTRRSMQMRVASIMRENGWHHERRMTTTGVRAWGFVRP